MSFPPNPSDGQRYIRNNTAYVYEAFYRIWRPQVGVSIEPTIDETDWVDQPEPSFPPSIIYQDQFQGTWNVRHNMPDLSLIIPQDKQYWIAQTTDPSISETVLITLPGLSGKKIYNGWIIQWIEAIGAYVVINTSSITVDQVVSYLTQKVRHLEEMIWQLQDKVKEKEDV
jgi:hypothetical protein